MLKDFNKVKSQLKELSTVLNSFKSEAVQLKIIELLLQGAPVEEIVKKETRKPLKTAKTLTVVKKRGRPRKSESQKPVIASAKRTRKKVGPTKVLRQLVEENFFSAKRPIGDIVKYTNEKLNLPLKSNDFSGILINYIRSNRLKRVKNSKTGQFEYINP